MMGQIFSIGPSGSDADYNVGGRPGGYSTIG